MSQPCTVVLGTHAYYPGETIYGRVNCIFSNEEKVRGIHIRFKGRAHIRWEKIRLGFYSAKEIYFEMVSDLLKSETTFPPGTYSYPFEFNLPNKLPPSLQLIHGGIIYFAEAVVDRAEAINYKHKLLFRVRSVLDLNLYTVPKLPVDIIKTRTPLSLSNICGTIVFNVHLPVTGYVPSEIITLAVGIKNDSSIKVLGVQFKLVQKFIYFAQGYTKEEIKLTEVFKIDNSTVSAGNEKLMKLEIQLPENIFNGNLHHCNLIESIVELKGKVILPLTHRDMRVCIPLTIGSVPYQE